jgi:hypothetical protein
MQYNIEAYPPLCDHVNFLYVCKTWDGEQDGRIIDEQYDAAVQDYVQRVWFIPRVILRFFYYVSDFLILLRISSFIFLSLRLIPCI